MSPAFLHDRNRIHVRSVMYRLRIVPVALVAVSVIGASLLARSNADAAGEPQRDTAEVLREYVAAFDSRLVALRGSETEVRRVATRYKLYFRKVYPRKSSTYFIEHASLTYLLDQEGHYVAFFPPGTSGERMAVLVREPL